MCNIIGENFGNFGIYNDKLLYSNPQKYVIIIKYYENSPQSWKARKFKQQNSERIKFLLQNYGSEMYPQFIPKNVFCFNKQKKERWKYKKH